MILLAGLSRRLASRDAAAFSPDQALDFASAPTVCVEFLSETRQLERDIIVNLNHVPLIACLQTVYEPMQIAGLPGLWQPDCPCPLRGAGSGAP